MPFLVISPYAKPNFVDHTLTDQTSIIRFIEDNWLGGQRIGQGSFDAIADRSTTCSTSENGESVLSQPVLFLDPDDRRGHFQLESAASH